MSYIRTIGFSHPWRGRGPAGRDAKLKIVKYQVDIESYEGVDKSMERIPTEINGKKEIIIIKFIELMRQ